MAFIISAYKTGGFQVTKIQLIHLLSKSNIYNADESGLNWRALPRKTLVCSNENTAPGRKVNKDRVKAMCYANASGSHKISIFIIGKYKKPRCFKNVTTLPVSYKA